MIFIFFLPANGFLRINNLVDIRSELTLGSTLMVFVKPPEKKVKPCTVCTGANRVAQRFVPGKEIRSTYIAVIPTK